MISFVFCSLICSSSIRCFSVSSVFILSINSWHSFRVASISALERKEISSNLSGNLIMFLLINTWFRPDAWLFCRVGHVFHSELRLQFAVASCGWQLWPLGFVPPLSIGQPAKKFFFTTPFFLSFWRILHGILRSFVYYLSWFAEWESKPLKSAQKPWNIDLIPS